MIYGKMSVLFSSITSVLRLGPREYVRQKFKLPLIKFIHDTLKLYKTRTKAGVDTIKEVLFRGTVIALITALLVWLSIFMYVAFYYVYVPAVSHERPVHLKFKPCGATDQYTVEKKAICSFPSAHVKLTKKQQLLINGQAYKIHLNLEMPESPANRELGMFMVCVEFMGKNGNLLNNSCRSAMLHYRGLILDTLYKLFFSPFYILGSAEEKQTVKIELFADYEEREDEPVTDIFIEIQTRNIEVYSAKFTVDAQFSGLRYVMFHWPVVSAAMGITANLFFIALVCFISWYQIINSEEYIEYLEIEKTKKTDDDECKGLKVPSILDNVLESDLGTLTLLPVFVGLDVGSSVLSYLNNNILNIPSRLARYIIDISEYNYFKQIETNDMKLR
ncbi:seipin isoform X1 [Diorhabda carinulata]|uniref:seipin isoform X1 n=1 Tax=Diorhabda carinulata TaxID=1163345 RepID=UPI0025A05BD4|nr:seipin isoform X1 [Diorhabda carinulata]